MQRVLSGENILRVQQGDHYGFSWYNKGVIKYAASETQNFCEFSSVYRVDDVVDLMGNRHGDRDYSLLVHFTACQQVPNIIEEPINQFPIDVPDNYTSPKPQEEISEESSGEESSGEESSGEESSGEEEGKVKHLSLSIDSYMHPYHTSLRH